MLIQCPLEKAAYFRQRHNTAAVFNTSRMSVGKRCHNSRKCDSQKCVTSTHINVTAHATYANKECHRSSTKLYTLFVRATRAQRVISVQCLPETNPRIHYALVCVLGGQLWLMQLSPPAANDKLSSVMEAGPCPSTKLLRRLLLSMMPTQATS